MTSSIPRRLPRPAGLAVVVAGLAVSALLAAPAQARVFVGFGFPLSYPPPGYYPPPPPIYYPPPPGYYPPPSGYYPPPPTVYAPPPAYAPVPGQPAGQSCYAGGHVCPMEHPVTRGSSCYCTINGSRVWGRSN